MTNTTSKVIDQINTTLKQGQDVIQSAWHSTASTGNITIRLPTDPSKHPHEVIPSPQTIVIKGSVQIGIVVFLCGRYFKNSWVSAVGVVGMAGPFIGEMINQINGTGYRRLPPLPLNRSQQSPCNPLLPPPLMRRVTI